MARHGVGLIRRWDEDDSAAQDRANNRLRYVLARNLLSLGDDHALRQLLDRFPEDEMAEWLYTRALVTFRIEGPGDKADAALQAALAENPFVPLYLFGAKKLPPRPPGHYGFGDENEAVLYVGYNAKAWSDTPGALNWCADLFAEEVQRTRSRAAPTKHVGRRS